MRKRLLSTLLALCMALALLPVTALAEDGGTPEITWLSVAGHPISYNEELDWLALYDTDTDRYSTIDRSTGARVEFDTISYFSDGLACVGKHNGGSELLYGYIDKTGAVAVPLEYDAVGDFSEGLAWVEKNGKLGYIDATGAVVIPLEYDRVGSFSEGLAWVEKNGKLGYIDKTGAVVIPVDYHTASSFSDGLALVLEGLFSTGKRGYIDKTGAVAIPLEYDRANSFSEGLAAVAKVGADGNGMYGYIDRTGATVIPLEYYLTFDFSDGLALVARAEGQYGYIDRTGATVIPFEYGSSGGFSDGLASVRKGDDFTGKWGYIDKTGAVVVPLEYDDAGSVPGGENDTVRLCYVQKGDSYGIFENPYSGASEEESAPTPGTPDIPTEPEQPATPTAPSDTKAVLSPQNLTVNGKDIQCEKYNIDGSNYFKLRDLAQLLSGTGSQFEVGYDAATATVSITTGAAYSPAGGELAASVDNSSTAQPSSQAILIDGVKHDELTVYNIGGSNFFQLRELGNILGFEVGYDQDTNTAIVRSTQK